MRSVPWKSRRAALEYSSIRVAKALGHFVSRNFDMRHTLLSRHHYRQYSLPAYSRRWAERSSNTNWLDAEIFWNERRLSGTFLPLNSNRNQHNLNTVWKCQKMKGLRHFEVLHIATCDACVMMYHTCSTMQCAFSPNFASVSSSHQSTRLPCLRFIVRTK